MRNKRWIKAGLLTATLIGLATPALAQHDDNGDGKGWRQRGGEQRGGGNGGGEARGRPDNNGGGEARARPDNNGGGDRGQGWNRQQSAAPVMDSPRQQRDFVPRPGTEVRQAPAAPPAPPPQTAAPDRNNWSGQARANNGWQGGGDRDRDRRDNNAGNRGNGTPDGRNRGDNNDWRNRNNGTPDWNRNDRGNDRDWNRDRDDRRNDDWRRDRDNSNRDRDWRGNNGRPPVFGRPPITNRWQGTRPWANDWRRDQRYNWQGWRNSHRDVFRLPNYYAPYGWSRGYFRFSIGAYLDELLFGSSYWIDDPYRYRLPPVYGPLRWVRYYDDALLVDIRDGYVVDIIYDVFW